VLPAETRGAAARRQSDRPPCISDSGDAEAPPGQRHPITPVRGGALRHVLSLALAGSLVVVALRAGLFESDRPSVPQRPATDLSLPRPTARPDEQFIIYLVSSTEDAQLLQTMLSGDRAEVRVVQSAAEEAAFREDLRQTNAIRTGSQFAEMDVVDLRVKP
jgi:hypothetical protein